jgi:hypothetical protein
MASGYDFEIVEKAPSKLEPNVIEIHMKPSVKGEKYLVGDYANTATVVLPSYSRIFGRFYEVC